MIKELDVREQMQVYGSIASLEHKKEFKVFCEYLRELQNALNEQLRNADGNFRQLQGKAQQIDELMNLIGSSREEFDGLSEGMKDNPI